MGSDSGATTSCWMADGLPDRSPLGADLAADACVIGAGIAGLSVAYHLAQAGRRVVVLDDGPIASGETGRTTAHLMTAFDDRYHEVERLHGPQASRLVAESHAAAVDRIEAIVAAEGIDCDFRRVDGYLFVPEGGDVGELDRERAAAGRAGLSDVELVERPPLSAYDFGPALRFPRQGEIHPVKYLRALAQAIERLGGRIHCGTHVTDVDDGAPAVARTDDGHTITAAAIVVATNTPINNRFVIHTKQAPYRTFVVGFAVARGAVPRIQLWDTGDPYHYVRIAGALDERSDLLIVGGEDHKTGQADDAAERFARLAAWTRERFPVDGDPLYAWSGQFMQPVDALAFIGRNPADRNVYIVTGDSGNGMTHGTIAGMLIADLVLGRDNPWADVYDPARKSLKAIGEFARENLNFARQYTDWATSGEVDDVAMIPPGHGALLRRHAHKIAVYRDDSGAPHAFDATCPHLGCIVEWNSVERTWDCPCHGSRFQCDGAVVNGPARVGLKRVDVP